MYGDLEQVQLKRGCRQLWLRVPMNVAWGAFKTYSCLGPISRSIIIIF